MMMIFRVFLPILLICLLSPSALRAAGSRLPADWPADATPPPNARILTSNVQQWTQSIAFELPGPEDQALAEVAERLEQRGWTTETVDRSGTPQRLRCSNRDGRTMTVLAHGTLAGSTAVLLTIYQPN